MIAGTWQLRLWKIFTIVGATKLIPKLCWSPMPFEIQAVLVHLVKNNSEFNSLFEII